MCTSKGPDKLRWITDWLRRWLEKQHLPWYLAVLAMLICAPSLSLDWLMDDHFHRASLTRPDWERHSRSPAELFAYIREKEDLDQSLLPIGYYPWWRADGLRLAFFRPLAGITHGFDYMVWPHSPFLMHVHSLAWLGGLVAVATFFFRRVLGTTWIAGLAALLFAVDDAHGFPAAWLANRNTLIGAFFGILALIAHDRWRRDEWRMGSIVAPLSLLLGLLAKESVAGVGAYLVAYALFLDRGTRLDRLWSLVPCTLIGIFWWVGYKTLGYGVAESAMYVDPTVNPARFAQAVGERAPILLFGQWLLSSNVEAVLSQRALYFMRLVALGFLAVLAAALIPLVRHDPRARFWTLGMVFSVLPVCTVIPGDRLLFFAGIGATALLAQFIAALQEKPSWLPSWVWWHLPARTLGIIFVVIHLVMAPIGLALTAASIERFGNIHVRAAASFPSDSAVRSQVFLVVNTPSYYIFAYSALLHALDGKPPPASAFVLGSGINPIEIYRPGERSLLVCPEGGFLAPPGSPRPGHEVNQPPFDMLYLHQWLDWLYRDRQPMRVGQCLELTYVTVEIRAITEDGRPSEVAFHFTNELESPSFRWLQWQNGVYAPFVVPEVGETVTMPAARVPI